MSQTSHMSILDPWQRVFLRLKTIGEGLISALVSEDFKFGFRVWLLLRIDPVFCS